MHGQSEKTLLVFFLLFLPFVPLWEMIILISFIFQVLTLLVLPDISLNFPWKFDISEM